MVTKKRVVGRDAGSGEFIPVKEARRRKDTAVVEHVPVPSPPPKPPAKKKPR